MKERKRIAKFALLGLQPLVQTEVLLAARALQELSVMSWNASTVPRGNVKVQALRNVRTAMPVNTPTKRSRPRAKRVL